jgi:hypothetical protein
MFQDLSRRIQAIEDWQANVKDQKIGFQLPAFFDRLPPVGGLATHFPARVR